MFGFTVNNEASRLIRKSSQSAKSDVKGMIRSLRGSFRGLPSTTIPYFHLSFILQFHLTGGLFALTSNPSEKQWISINQKNDRGNWQKFGPVEKTRFLAEAKRCWNRYERGKNSWGALSRHVTMGLVNLGRPAVSSRIPTGEPLISIIITSPYVFGTVFTMPSCAVDAYWWRVYIRHDAMRRDARRRCKVTSRSSISDHPGTPLDSERATMIPYPLKVGIELAN